MNRIVDMYDTDLEYRISEAYPDGGLGSLSARLARAALNQISEGQAAFSRYGIWANTVRDHIREAVVEIDKGNMNEAHRLLRSAANSLSAFSELQAGFDPDKLAQH